MPHKKGHKLTGQGGKPLGSTTKRGGAQKPTTDKVTGVGPVKSGEKYGKDLDKIKKVKDEIRRKKRQKFWENVQDTTAQGEKVAEEAKNQRTLTGYSPQASRINRGGSGVYNYQPKQMSDLPGDTSPMVRFDSDYEKQKKSMGL